MRPPSARARAATLGAFALAVLLPRPLRSQADTARPPEGPPHPVRHGISIGDYPRVKGIRINYRDRGLERVDGVNVTVWTPYQPVSGTVSGAAIGLPLTGARRIEGLGLGLFGVSADDGISGIGIGGLGVGAGGRLEGIMIGGLGVGSGGGLRGIGIGGLGVGGGGDLTGLMVGGLGVGGGGSTRGVSISVLGVGGGGKVSGVQVAGLGVGAGGDVSGLSIGGLGIGSGGDVTGVQIAGLGIGAGGTVRWVSVAVLGVGAPTIQGVAVAGGVGGEQVEGAVIAPIFLRIENDGLLRGASLSAVNLVQGRQRGLTIGIVNYARRLHGVQIGLVNVVRDNPDGRRVLPLVNWHFEDGAR